MSSAFKNFFITFTICLLVFGYLGMTFALPWLTEAFDFSDMGSESTDESSLSVEDSSADESFPPVNIDDYDENGDVFRAVVMFVDSENRASNIAVINANAKSKRFTYCVIPSTVRMMNEVGVTVDAGDLFGTASCDTACQIATAMTGLQVNYCLKYNRDSLKKLASSIPGASIELDQKITFVNPAYKDYVYVEGVPYPDDYYIVIDNTDGRVLLRDKQNGKYKIDWILEYNPNLDGSSYEVYASLIAKSLMKQFLAQGSSMRDTVASLRSAASSTNMSSSDVANHKNTMCSYNDFQRFNYTYKKWETSIKELRELDGSR